MTCARSLSSSRESWGATACPTSRCAAVPNFFSSYCCVTTNPCFPVKVWSSQGDAWNACVSCEWWRCSRTISSEEELLSSCSSVWIPVPMTWFKNRLWQEWTYVLTASRGYRTLNIPPSELGLQLREQTFGGGLSYQLSFPNLIFRLEFFHFHLCAHTCHPLLSTFFSLLLILGYLHHHPILSHWRSTAVSFVYIRSDRGNWPSWNATAADLALI